MDASLRELERQARHDPMARLRLNMALLRTKRADKRPLPWRINGYGCGDGHGNGCGDGYGNGYGCGNGYANDYGDGNGNGNGDGYGNGKFTSQQLEGVKVEGLNILCMQGAWVLLAEVEDRGPELALSNVSCIRRWGTSKGLGQLAAEGKQGEATKLDAEPDQVVDRIQVIRAIPCKAEAWKSYIKAK